MVRNYIRKTNRRWYTTETFEEALAEIRAGHTNALNASKKYNIPVSTILSHLQGRRGNKSKSLGRSTAISKEYEQQLANCLLTMEKYGFTLSRKEVLELVRQFVKEHKLKTPFRDDLPGEDWYQRFKIRHNLCLKQSQTVKIGRQQSSDSIVIQQYFTLLENTIKELGLENTPSNIWNIEESTFCTDPLITKVIGENLSSTQETTALGRNNITVLFAASASGEKAPPLIIFKGKYIWDQWLAPENNGFPGITYAATASGCMESSVLENYFEKHFVKSIDSSRPTLLIYDGHSTHISIKLIEKACESNVIILKLPPHTSHILQPLDVNVFVSLKSALDEKLVTWQRKNIRIKFPKKQFSIMIGDIWRELNPEIIMNGFNKAGIYQFSRNVSLGSMCSAIVLNGWQELNDNKPKIKEEPSIIEEVVCHPLINIEMLPQATRNSSSDAYDSPQPTTSVTIENALLNTVKSNSKPIIQKKKRVRA